MLKGNKIKRFYDIEPVNQPQWSLGELIQTLTPFAVSLGCDVYQCGTNKDFLAKQGVFIDSIIVYKFGFPTDDEAEADDIEDKLKSKAADIGIELREVQADIDFDIVAQRACDGLLYLPEEIVIPKDATDFEAVLYAYIDNLNSENKTVVITDSYFYGSDDKEYISLLEHLISRTKAKEIKSLMPENQLKKSTYKTIQRDLGDNITFTSIPYPHCHERFWLCPESRKGFIMGTSLSGVSKQIFRVDMLHEDEVDILIKEFGL